MDRRDPFPRRTASPAALAPWAGELARNLGGLVDSYSGRAVLDPRVREELILAVTDVNGCRYCEWIHGSWSEFLGDIDGHDAADAALAYARASATIGRPDDVERLTATLGPGPARAVRATVAQITLANLVGNTVDGLIARITGKRPADPPRALAEAATVGLALPLAVPMLAVGAALRGLNRLAPPRTGVRVPDAGEANLLVHVLAEALAPLEANAALRLALTRLPLRLAVGIRAGRTGATLRFGAGAIALENGLADDALIVIEGDVGPLLRLAARPVVRDLARIRVRPA